MGAVEPAVTLEQVEVQGFGCVQQATLRLGRLHALVGPNDSGKTTLLRAISMAVSGQVVQGLGPAPWASTHAPSPKAVSASRVVQPVKGAKAAAAVTASFACKPGTDLGTAIAGFARGVGFLRVEPAMARQAMGLLNDRTAIPRLAPNAHGLAAWYDALMNRDLDAFVAIREEFASLFPAGGRLALVNEGPGKAFRLLLADGQEVPAAAMSEGMLYWLAFRFLRHIDPPSILLIEEPENGLHPARIREVMAVLREVSKTTQIVLTTHSPLVLNELAGDEVSVVTRPPGQGTQVKLLSETPNFQARSEIYALGELWLSYCDGDTEAPLFAASP
jgi:predicted ATPase